MAEENTSTMTAGSQGAAAGADPGKSGTAQGAAGTGAGDQGNGKSGLHDPEKYDQATALELINKLRQREKDADKAEAELAKIKKAEQDKKDAELSELDKIKKQLATAQAEADQIKLENMQIKAATETGLPQAFADRLKGETLDAMITDAKALLDAMPKGSPKAAGNTGATNPGDGGSGKKETDAEKRSRLLS